MKAFSSSVAVTGEATPNQSGKFEVTVNGDLVHSKINGDGFVDTDDKMDAISAKIKALL